MMHAKALGARIRCRSGPGPDLLNDVTLTTTPSDTVGTPGPHFISPRHPASPHTHLMQKPDRQRPFPRVTGSLAVLGTAGFSPH